jgi:hypothetical protein
MALRKLDRGEWGVFFDRIAVGMIGRHVEIEVASLAIGDQILASWLPLIGMSYDAKSDAVEIALAGFEHVVSGPQEMFVDDPLFASSILGIVDRDGGLQIVRLRDPLMLPAQV